MIWLRCLRIHVILVQGEVLMHKWQWILHNPHGRGRGRGGRGERGKSTWDRGCFRGVCVLSLSLSCLELLFLKLYSTQILSNLINLLPIMKKKVNCCISWIASRKWIWRLWSILGSQMIGEREETKTRVGRGWQHDAWKH